jgi:hypothetical protein
MIDQVRTESRVDQLEKSNEGRGARIGCIETDVAIIKNEIQTKETTKKGSNDSVKWAVVVIISILSIGSRFL